MLVNYWFTQQTTTELKETTTSGLMSTLVYLSGVLQLFINHLSHVEVDSVDAT